MGKKTVKNKRAGKSRSEPATVVKDSSIHGRGLFADQKITRGSYIGRYEGKRVGPRGKDGTYVLWIFEEDEVCFGIDGKNHMRFINHSAKPNAEFREDECFAIRAIKPGDEITFDYGEEWHEEEEDEEERIEPKTVVRQSKIHGRGLFAEERIKKGTYIGTYEGKRVGPKGKDGTYVLWVYEGEEVSHGIDGKNHMRFINHSAKPNAEFLEDECYAIRGIKPGDEITFHYGEEWLEEAEA